MPDDVDDDFEESEKVPVSHVLRELVKGGMGSDNVGGLIPVYSSSVIKQASFFLGLNIFVLSQGVVCTVISALSYTPCTQEVRLSLFFLCVATLYAIVNNTFTLRIGNTPAHIWRQAFVHVIIRTGLQLCFGVYAVHEVAYAWLEREYIGSRSCYENNTWMCWMVLCIVLFSGVSAAYELIYWVTIVVPSLYYQKYLQAARRRENY